MLTGIDSVAPTLRVAYWGRREGPAAGDARTPGGEGWGHEQPSKQRPGTGRPVHRLRSGPASGSTARRARRCRASARTAPRGRRRPGPSTGTRTSLRSRRSATRACRSTSCTRARRTFQSEYSAEIVVFLVFRLIFVTSALGEQAVQNLARYVWNSIRNAAALPVLPRRLGSRSRSASTSRTAIIESWRGCAGRSTPG